MLITTCDLCRSEMFCLSYVLLGSFRSSKMFIVFHFSFVVALRLINTDCTRVFCIQSYKFIRALRALQIFDPFLTTWHSLSHVISLHATINPVLFFLSIILQRFNFNSIQFQFNSISVQFQYQFHLSLKNLLSSTSKCSPGKFCFKS